MPSRRATRNPAHERARDLRKHLLRNQLYLFWSILGSVSPAYAGPDPDAIRSDPPASAPAEAASSRDAGGTATRPAAPSHHVAPKALSARPDTSPPGYVRTVDQFGFPGTQDLKWLEFGAEHRTRFELRRDEYRENLDDDTRFVMRSRGYVGLREALDPLRLGFEFQDARVEGNDFSKSTREIDQADVLQGFAELYFQDLLGEGRPARFQAGRMTLDYVDRKLVARQRWGNAVNSFDGFRLQLGQQRCDWQVDVFAVQPVERRLTRPDHGDEERWFYGAVGAWRRWSKWITLEPYYFVLDQDAQRVPDREIHTLGLHGYGPIGQSGFDYDLDMAFQWGQDGTLHQRAHALSGELGYSFQHAWKPRVAGLLYYATGDASPNDGIDHRFDRLFGVSHQYNGLDLFEWRNMISPVLRVQASPTDKLRLESFYRLHYLASDTDAWTVTGRRAAGQSEGHFVGQSLEAAAIWTPIKVLDLEAGYAHFIPGPFARETGPADDSDFFYVQTTLRLDR